LAAGHLVTVIGGACDCLPDRSLGPAAEIFQWYATMSGADSNYGFFAPQVGALHRARFLLQDDEGSTWSDVFDQSNSPEARLRLTGIVDSAFMSGEADESPEWRKVIVRSWAATMLTRHPTAVSLTVIVEAYDVPSMADYRAGSRPSWQVVYQAQVQRHSPAVQARTEE
jgi:hypothetical protein